MEQVGYIDVSDKFGDKSVGDILSYFGHSLSFYISVGQQNCKDVINIENLSPIFKYCHKKISSSNATSVHIIYPAR